MTALRQTLDATAAGGRTMTVTELMTALASELENVRALGLRIEGGICALAVKNTIDPMIIGELQQLDAIIQHIAALRDFTGALAQTASASESLAVDHALSRISLTALRVRLSGEEASDDDGTWEML